MGMKKIVLVLFAASIPLLARSAGAPAGHTGAPGDNVCTACHRGNDLNSAGGSVRIQASPFRPGQTQTVQVTVGHPEAARWGFQITARWAKDPTQNAGRFNAPNGDVQVLANNYATHTAAGTVSNGANGTKTFTVEWVAPEGTDDSDVIFYAAGNAANNSSNNQGDRIYTASTRVQADPACGFTERPVITFISDAASGNRVGSAGAILSIYGSNLAVVNVNRNATLGYVRDNNFPKELGCVAVEVGGQRAPILYLSEKQINIQVPALTALGDVPVRVIMNADRPNAVMGEPTMVTLQSVSPAFFTFGGRSVAARVAGSADIIADPAVVATGRPARPGEVIELYGTGLGATQPAVAPGVVAPNQAVPTTQKVEVTIGNTRLPDADVLYSGLAPGNISGLNQINVRIPASASNGDLPIMLSVGGRQSTTGVTIPVRAQ